jgi:hypothetical protein
VKAHRSDQVEFFFPVDTLDDLLDLRRRLVDELGLSPAKAAARADFVLARQHDPDRVMEALDARASYRKDLRRLLLSNDGGGPRATSAKGA